MPKYNDKRKKTSAFILSLVFFSVIRVKLCNDPSSVTCCSWRFVCLFTRVSEWGGYFRLPSRYLFAGLWLPLAPPVRLLLPCLHRIFSSKIYVLSIFNSWFLHRSSSCSSGLHFPTFLCLFTLVFRSLLFTNVRLFFSVPSCCQLICVRVGYLRSIRSNIF